MVLKGNVSILEEHFWLGLVCSFLACKGIQPSLAGVQSEVLAWVAAHIISSSLISGMQIKSVQIMAMKIRAALAD